MPTRRSRIACSAQLVVLVVVVVGAGALSCTTGSTDARGEVLRAEDEWAAALLRNDAAAVDRYLDDEWAVIDPEGGVTNKAAYLGWIKSGDVAMKALELIEEPMVRVYDDTAIVITRAESRGEFKGNPFSADERATDVFVKRGGRWRAVLSHISTVAGNTPADANAR